MKMSDSKKIINYMMKRKREGADVTHWTVTKKSLVMYNTQDQRTIVPLSKIL